MVRCPCFYGGSRNDEEEKRLQARWQDETEGHGHGRSYEDQRYGERWQGESYDTGTDPCSGNQEGLQVSQKIDCLIYKVTSRTSSAGCGESIRVTIRITMESSSMPWQSLLQLCRAVV